MPPTRPNPSASERKRPPRGGRGRLAVRWALLTIVPLCLALAAAMSVAGRWTDIPDPREAAPATLPPKAPTGRRMGTPLGTNGPLTREHIDSVADQLGVSWIRADVEWRWHDSREKFDADMREARAGHPWSVLDDVRASIAYAHSKGVRVLAIAMSAPRWARGADRSDGGNPWHQAILPAQREDFAQYFRQVCLAGADAVELINEPNAGTEYALGPDHPRATHPDERVDDYVLLVRKVYQVVHADPATRHCKLGLGGVSPVGHEMVASDRFIHAVKWYARLFDARADDRKTPVSVAGHFDFACVHPYNDANTDKGPTEWDHRWSRFALQYGDAAYAHGMAEVHRIRQILVAAGEGDKRLWATEVGNATFGGECRSKPCVSPERQALWLDQYLRAWFSKESTGWHAPLSSHYFGAFSGPLIVYQWRDKSDGQKPPLDKEGFFGLQTHDGRRKPAFELLAKRARQPLAGQ